MNPQTRVLTELDFRRLSALAKRASADAADSTIDDVLDQASVVAGTDVPPDIVTMYSQVVLQHLDDGRTTRLTLCYPRDAEPAQGFVSVLSPIGMSLIGRSLGEVARWTCPDGEERMAEVKAVSFQPEASGDFVS